jgi:hypothetical protein
VGRNRQGGKVRWASKTSATGRTRDQGRAGEGSQCQAATKPALPLVAAGLLTRMSSSGAAKIGLGIHCSLLGRTGRHHPHFGAWAKRGTEETRKAERLRRGECGRAVWAREQGSQGPGGS